MAHGDAREGKWRGKWRMECVASTLHTTSEHAISSITTADAHTSAASSRLNWRPSRVEWIRSFRRKTKSNFCTFAITFQLASTGWQQETYGLNILDCTHRETLQICSPNWTAHTFHSDTLHCAARTEFLCIIYTNFLLLKPNTICSKSRSTWRFMPAAFAWSWPSQHHLFVRVWSTQCASVASWSLRWCVAMQHGFPAIRLPCRMDRSLTIAHNNQWPQKLLHPRPIDHLSRDTS